MNNQFTPTSDGGYIVICSSCRTPVFIEGVALEQLTQWQDGALIQRAMPALTAAERELFISGTCGKCWDAMFSEDEAS